MFDTIDALDCVALLLGATLAYLATRRLPLQRPDLPAPAALLIFVGLGMILAYGLSEALHMLMAGRLAP